LRCWDTLSLKIANVNRITAFTYDHYPTNKNLSRVSKITLGPAQRYFSDIEQAFAGYVATKIVLYMVTPGLVFYVFIFTLNCSKQTLFCLQHSDRKSSFYIFHKYNSTVLLVALLSNMKVASADSQQRTCLFFSICMEIILTDVNYFDTVVDLWLLVGKNLFKVVKITEQRLDERRSDIILLVLTCSFHLLLS